MSKIKNKRSILPLFRRDFFIEKISIFRLNVAQNIHFFSIGDKKAPFLGELSL